jgi:hypothetical protein
VQSGTLLRPSPVPMLRIVVTLPLGECERNAMTAPDLPAELNAALNAKCKACRAATPRRARR